VSDRHDEPVVKVVLCDDHRMFREGAKRILNDESDIEVIGDVPTVDEAISLCRAFNADVLILDISLGGGATGLDGIEILRKECPACRVLVVSMHRERSFVRASIERGGHGYLTKDAAGSELALAVRTVASGREFMPARFIVEPSVKDRDLTPRQREILGLIAVGHTSAEIAELLHLSKRTVETHRAQLAIRLGAHSRADLVRSAREDPLI